MSSGGGKGGSQTSTTSIPEWVQEPAQRNLARAEEISQIGYVPYMGADVAAFTDTQQAAFANNNATANAFGMQGGTYNMPEATTYANGVQGYSSYPMYQESVDQLAAERPGQYDAIMAQFIDPTTGASPTASTAATTAQQSALAATDTYGGFHDDQQQSQWEAANAGGGMFDGSFSGGLGSAYDTFTGQNPNGPRGTGIFDGDGFVTDITGGAGLNNGGSSSGGGGK